MGLPLRRVHDPHVRLLVHDLSGESRPTWLMEWNSLDSWGLDRRGRVATAVSKHYRDLGSVCGVEVYVRNEVRRRPASPDASC